MTGSRSNFSIMLLNHRLRTDSAVAHLLPQRLVDVTWGPGAREGERSVLFFYEHLEGGWAVGEVGCDPLTGEPDAQRVSVQTSVGLSNPEELDTAPLLARFDRRMSERAANGTIARLWPRQSLPVYVELQICAVMQRKAAVLAGGWAADAPSAQGLFQEMRAATKNILFEDLADATHWEPEAVSLLRWLESPSVSHGAPSKWAKLEARIRAYLLTEAATSQQDGVEDALRVLEREGTEAFCAMLPDSALDYLAKRVAKAREGFARPRMPRYTVADFVHTSLSQAADLLLKQWQVSPMRSAGAAL